MNKKIALISLLAVLALVNWSIYGKEQHLARGGIVYLPLAPVDPRSLMQGDYMSLRFQLANEVRDALVGKEKQSSYLLKPSDGYVIVHRDERNIGVLKELYRNQDLWSDELLLQYRVRKGVVSFATNAFFFQEGHGKYFQSARYGQFRVNESGELLLVGMYDESLNKLGAGNTEL